MLILSLNANTMELNGTKIICTITTIAGKTLNETIVIIVKGKISLGQGIKINLYAIRLTILLYYYVQR